MTPADSRSSPRSPLLPGWLLWTVAAMVCWAGWAIVAKYQERESKRLGVAFTPWEVQAISTLAVAPVVLVLSVMRRPPDPGRRVVGDAWGFASGMVSCLGNVAFFQLLARGEQSSAVVPLTNLYPLVTVLLAVPLLRERLAAVQVLGVGMSLAAMYLFNASFKAGMLSPLLLGALGAVVPWGVSGLLQKISTKHISGERSSIGFLVGFVPLAAWIFLTSNLAARLSEPGLLASSPFLLSLVIGLLLALGNVAILKAFASDGNASVIAPLGGLYSVLSIPASLWLFGEELTLPQSIGIVLALAAVVALSREPAPNTPGAP